MTKRLVGRRVLRLAALPFTPLIGSIRRVRTNDRMAALTFDDGPDEHHTMRILEVLGHRRATATFFVLAQRAAQYPEIIAAIQRGGHEIALHGDDHRPVIHCSTHEKIDRINGGKRRLESMLDGPVRFFRPPYGWQGLPGFLIARLSGLQVVAWTASGGDWLEIAPTEIADRVAVGIESGAIVLLHDRCEPWPTRPHDTPAANLDRAAVVDAVLRHAASRHIELVSVGTLLGHGVPLRRPWFDSGRIGGDAG